MLKGELMDLMESFQRFFESIPELIEIAINAFSNFLLFISQFLGMIKIFVLEIHKMNASIANVSLSLDPVFNNSNVSNISNTNFVFNSINLYKYIGAFRYIIGEPLFITFKLFCLLGVGFIIYKLAYMIYKYIVSAISGFTDVKSTFLKFFFKK